MRALVVLGLCMVLAGCWVARQAERSEADPAPVSLAEPAPVNLAESAPVNLAEPAPANLADPTPANLNDALAECHNGYPDQITQAVARAGCVIKATEILRPLLPFPELLDQENALRKSLAEQVQSGKVSLLERNDQIHKLHLKLLAEEQGRLQSAPPDATKTSLAATQWRLSNPEACTRLGRKFGELLLIMASRTLARAWSYWST
jgi:hypothetical protein